MKIKLLPKNEQELSKVFVFFTPLVILLAVSVNLLRDFYLILMCQINHLKKKNS